MRLERAQLSRKKDEKRMVQEFLSIDAVLNGKYGQLVRAGGENPVWYVNYATRIFDADDKEVGRLKRHDCVRLVERLVDGDGNDICGERDDDKVYIVSENGKGWIEKVAIRISDELDGLAEMKVGCTKDRRQEEADDDRLWRKLASALRTDNPVKLKLFADKVLRRKKSRLTSGRAELLRRAKERIGKYQLRYFAERIEQMGLVDEVADVRSMVQDKEDEDVWLGRIDAHGLFLIELQSVFGDPEDKSFNEGRGFAVDPNQLRWLLHRIQDHYLKKEKSFYGPIFVNARLEDTIALRLQAAEECELHRNPSSDHHVHSICLQATGGAEYDGYYFRLVQTRGHDDFDNKYDHWYTCNDHYVFRNARDHAMHMVFHDGHWLLGVINSADQNTPPEKVLATARRLFGPWRSRTKNKLEPNANLISIDDFCTIRCNEGDIYYSRATAAPFSPKNEDQLADAHAAQAAYTEAIDSFRGTGINQATKLRAFLQRARSRALFDRRAALIDIKAAHVLNSEHAPLYLLRGAIQADLGDFDAAYNDLRLAAHYGATPADCAQLQRTLRHYKKSDLSAQALRGKLLLASASSSS